VTDFSRLKVFYIGSSGDSGNGLDKRRALTSLGVELASFDTQPYLRAASRLWASLAHRWQVGPPVVRLNRDLLESARTLRGVTHVWIDKGTWIWRETLERLRDDSGARLIHYANDAMFRANRSRHFRASLPLYDFAFTTKPWELTAYQRAGARCVRSIPEAVDESRFRPRTTTPEQRAAFGTAVSFIGRYEPHYARTLRAVAESGHDLGVWGPRWPRYARRHGWARPVVRAGGVWFDDYPVALSCTDIALGLLSKRFPETTTTRSFEIPACGTFLLAERTEDHLALYAEGREAEFFADRDELIDKLRFYAVNRDARERIARAGRERYLRSGYTRRARFREMLDVVTRA
jgi:hypothetical protein